MNAKCPNCQHEFYVNTFRDSRTLAEKFWEKVSVRGPTECWPWTAGTKGNNEYGNFCVAGTPTSVASRMAWILSRGPIPEGLWVLHTCDNPPCCNPAHLFLGTPKRNTSDMHTKGRAKPPRGQRNGNHKLTELQVILMKQKMREGQSTRSVGLEFGVSHTTADWIKRGKLWKHVT